MTVTQAFEAWRADGRSYRHRGHTIFYRDQGEGPVLLAIHGFPSASWDFHAVWPALTARFRVIAPDMLGYGWSDKPTAYAYSVLDQAEMHRGLLRELGVTRVHLLAHDVGVSVAAELLAGSSDVLTIESVCLLNGGVFPETHRPRPIQSLLASPLGALLAPITRKSDFERGLRSVFAPRSQPSREFLDELWTLLRHDEGRRVLHHLLGYMKERRVHRERWVKPILAAQVPIRLIDGTFDPVSGKTLVARYRELVRDPDVIELADVGHYPHVEAPHAVLRAFFDFHARIAGAGTRD
jgi:pimeloyl-ACP methyl ester carboxylesterase